MKLEKRMISFCRRPGDGGGLVPAAEIFDVGGADQCRHIVGIHNNRGDFSVVPPVRCRRTRRRRRRQRRPCVATYGHRTLRVCGGGRGQLLHNTAVISVLARDNHNNII
uniref:Uncharacterized protein n=1 Tax=Schizaphis graminum TaxID=13262 RepID=A0A2S2NYL7_SCHGA